MGFHLRAFLVIALALCGANPASAQAVALDSPTSGTLWSVASVIPLAASVDGPSTATLSVEFLAGATSLGVVSSQPYSLDWLPGEPGVYTLTARATAADISTTMSLPVRIAVGFPPRDCLLVVGFDPLTVGDQAIADRLATWGYRVVPVRAVVATTASADGMAMIFISESVSSSNVGTKWRNSTVPVLCAEDYNYDEFGMTGLVIDTDYGFIPNLSRMVIAEGGSPLTGGLPPGVFDVFTSPGRLQWGIPNGNATIAATIEGEPTKAAIFGYRTGAAMKGGIDAPARRTGFFLQDFTAEMTLLTPEGLVLFDAAVRWTGGQETDEPPPAPESAALHIDDKGVARVTWTCAPEFVDGFEVETSPDGIAFVRIGRFDADARAVIHAPGGEPPLAARVRSWNGNGYSEWLVAAPPVEPLPEAWELM